MRDALREALGMIADRARIVLYTVEETHAHLPQSILPVEWYDALQAIAATAEQALSEACDG